MTVHRFALALVCGTLQAAGAGVLPIYIEENHVGSFGWFAQHTALDQPHALVLIDAHSDASAVGHSDALRTALRRVTSTEERNKHIAEWRRRGRVQAYNWIEPLMPDPIRQVLWIPRWELAQPQSSEFHSQASRSIDGRLEFERREAGELGQHWQVLAGRQFGRWEPGELPILASIDLDFFAHTPLPVARERFQALWYKLLEFPKLSSVTFAISRAWLSDDAEAFALLLMVLDELRLVHGARIHFEPMAPRGPDDSLRATEFPDEKAPVFAMENAPAELRAFCVLHSTKLNVSIQAERWRSLCDSWREDYGAPRIEPDGYTASTDGIFRVPAARLPALRIEGDHTTGHVKWYGLVPAASCYNLLPGIDLGKGFVPGAGPWVRERRVELGETFDAALAPDVWKRLLDSATGWGRVRMEAEVEIESGAWRRTDVTELRASEGTGFRAALTEQFRLPYVFGAGFYEDRVCDGPESGIGNDCANFLIAAWRRTGRALSWGSPAQLARMLDTIEEHAERKRVHIDPADVEAGVAIDFGSHMAALWEDRSPRGVLDPRDIVVHHLSGYPERTTLGALAKNRPRYAVRTVPRASACRVVIGGDVVLASDAGHRAFAEMAPWVKGTDLAVVNLEGLPAHSPLPNSPPRYQFAFPPERLTGLVSAGIGAVGLANNHAGDAGPGAVAGALEELAKSGLRVFGIGRDSRSAAQPYLFECRGVRLAFFAVACVDALAAGRETPGVAVLPAHEAEVEAALANAISEGYTPLVLCHWGSEYSPVVEEEQRHWARWFIQRGAGLVVGSHPHVVQPMDCWRGRPIAYSLGNALFPEVLRGADSGSWLEVNFGARGQVVSVRQTRITK